MPRKKKRASITRRQKKGRKSRSSPADPLKVDCSLPVNQSTVEGEKKMNEFTITTNDRKGVIEVSPSLNLEGNLNADGNRLDASMTNRLKTNVTKVDSVIDIDDSNDFVGKLKTSNDPTFLSPFASRPSNPDEDEIIFDDFDKQDLSSISTSKSNPLSGCDK